MGKNVQSNYRTKSRKKTIIVIIFNTRNAKKVEIGLERISHATPEGEKVED